MRWCDFEQNDFPDVEFTVDGGVVYHRRPGGYRHLAGLSSVTTQYPEDQPPEVYLYEEAEEPIEDDGSSDGEGRD